LARVLKYRSTLGFSHFAGNQNRCTLASVGEVKQEFPGQMQKRVGFTGLAVFMLSLSFLLLGIEKPAYYVMD